MSIGTRTTNGTTRLSETRRLELARAGDGTTLEPKVPPVASVRFAYYGALNPGDAPDWHDSWKDEDKLPDLVRMSMTFSDTRVGWPDLIVTPLITADESCTFDLLARTCSGRAR
jgi:hypothetical protein